MSEPEKSPLPAVQFVHTTNIPSLLRSMNISLAVTTYQAQRVLFFHPKDEKLSMLMRIYDRPTGLAIHKNKLALCAKSKTWLFNIVRDVRNIQGEKEPYDFCYAPRMAWVTGDIAGHELAFLNEELHVINTRFSCISKFSSEKSFEVVWKPKFISEIAPEDRCHLNGFAVEKEKIKYLTVLGLTDKDGGWREDKAHGGALITYPDSEVVTSGLSMPHSPRLYAGKLWVLNSGIAEVQIVDANNGNRQSIAKLPGFLRGLAFNAHYAFIGLSKMREKRTFGGLPIENEFKELECAIYVLDLKTGQVAGFIRFTRGVEELFDIQIIPGTNYPHILGFEDDTVDGLFVLS